MVASRLLILRLLGTMPGKLAPCFRANVRALGLVIAVLPKVSPAAPEVSRGILRNAASLAPHPSNDLSSRM